MRGGPLPGDLRPIAISAEDRVHQHAQVVPGGGVAVHVDCAVGLEHAAQLDQADRHHREVGGELVAPERFDERFEQRACTPPPPHDHVFCAVHSGQQARQRLFRVWAPVPGVVECLDLLAGGAARLVAEEHIVAGVGVERRIQVDQVHAGVGNLLAEHGEIVAVEERAVQVVGSEHRRGLSGPSGL